MQVRLTPDAKNSRAQATVNDIDRAGTPGGLEIYTTPLPANPEDGPGAATKLVDMLFELPCGTVADETATLVFDGPGVGLAIGDAAWARFVDGNGNPIFDCDVTNLAGDGFVRLSVTSISPGLPVEAVVANFT